MAKVRTRDDASGCVRHVETKTRRVEAEEWAEGGDAMDIGQRFDVERSSLGGINSRTVKGEFRL